MQKNSQRKILLTGFVPFGNDTINPSWEVVKKLQGKKINYARIIGMKLPVVFGKAGRLIINAIEKYQPEWVISLGQQTGGSIILLERVGLNIHLGKDESKIKPKNEFIIPDGPAAYFVKLPFKSILSKLRKNEIPVNISFNAGTHLCNEVLYTMLNYVSTHKLSIKVGFIHIPMLPEQIAGKNKAYPSMSLETLVKGIKLIVESCLTK